MYHNKAQSLSINTLVIIGLAIIVLILSIVIYTKVYKGTGNTISSCSNLGGECKPSCSDDENSNFLAKCDDNGVCCVSKTKGPS